MRAALILSWVSLLLALIVFGWTLATIDVAPSTQVAYQVITVGAEQERSEWEVALEVETPLADALVDWDEVDRQTDCLWVFLQDHFGHEITLDRVLAAAAWTDELGGACLVIGEDDEEQG